MSNLCNLNSTLSNITEIAEDNNRFKLSPLLSNDFVYNGFLNMEKGEINP